MNQYNPAAGLASSMDRPGTFVPSYQVGGMIGAGGMPDMTGVQSPRAGMAPPSAGGKNVDYAQMEQQMRQIATQHPERIAQIRQIIMQEIQSGNMTMQELNMMGQLARVAAQNPEMYTYVRQYAIQQGLATEQDLPVEYDPGLAFVLILAVQAVTADMGGQNIMQGQVPTPSGTGMPGVPSMATGGGVPQSSNPDGSVLINAHEGEYVVPAHVVKMKGKEFFDSLVEKYKQKDGSQ